MVSTVRDDDSAPALDPTLTERMRDVLEDHSIAFAMTLGSQARGTADVHSDVNIAVETERVVLTNDEHFTDGTADPGNGTHLG